MATEANLRRDTELDLEFFAGDTLNATNATFTDDDGTDYTGYDSAEWLFKNNEDDDDDDAAFSFSTGITSGVETLVLADGSFYINAGPSVTDSKEGVYFHAMKVKSGTNEYTVVSGRATVKQRRTD